MNKQVSTLNSGQSDSTTREKLINSVLGRGIFDTASTTTHRV